MTPSKSLPPVNTLSPAEPELRLSAAAELAVERTRLLYQGSQVPTLFMLLSGLACAYLLWSPENAVRLSGWLVWLVLLAVLALAVLAVVAVGAVKPQALALAVLVVMVTLASLLLSEV